MLLKLFPYSSVVLASIVVTAQGQVEPNKLHGPTLGPAQELSLYSFTEVGQAYGLEPFVNDVHGGGVAVEDVDGDGDFDLFLAQSVGFPPQFYLWDADSRRYVNRTNLSGLSGIPSGRCAIFFDYNADGRLDLLVGTEEPSSPSAFFLYEHGDDVTFSDVTAAAGLLVPPTGANRAPIAVGDLNNDGNLDFWSGIWDQNGTAQGSLFLNNGNGTFTDISASSGILSGTPNTNWQAMWHDFDGNGFQDLYLAVDFARNRMFMNQGNNTVVDLAPAFACANSMNDMGLALADYDEDGDFDIYITNISTGSNHNVLYRNDSVGSNVKFIDVSETLGVDAGSWGWGVTFFDPDNDGHLDLFANNGFVLPPNDMDPSIFHESKGNGTFTGNRAHMVGLQDRFWSVGVIPYDFDLDGDQDLIQTTNDGLVRLLENDTSKLNNPNYLAVRPRLDTNNRWAIGAVVRAKTSFNTQSRLMTAGSSYQSQEPSVAFFGMNHDDVAEQVIVEFPNGVTTVVPNVACNQTIEVAPGPLTDVGRVFGTRGGGNLLELRVSDNQRMEIHGPLCSLTAGWQSSVVSPTKVDVSVECATTRTGILAAIELKNWNSGNFNLVKGFSLSLFDAIQTATSLDAAKYVSDSGRVEVRLTASFVDGAIYSPEFTMLVDLVGVNVQ